MPDQADDLRRFVAEQNDGHQEGPRVGFPHAQPMGRIQLLENRYHQYHSPAAKAEREHRLTSLPPETAEVYRAKLARLRPMIPRGKSPFQSIAAELSKVERLPALGFLWTTLESDLERWVRVGGFDKPNLSTEALAGFWEMMQRREERAT